MREYQQKMLNSKSEIVFCNWERGKGKTEAIFEKMLKERGSLLYVSQNTDYFRVKIESFIKEMEHKELGDIHYNIDHHNGIHEEIDCIKINKNESYVRLKSGLMIGESISIKYAVPSDVINEKIRGCRIDIAFFDECIPTSSMINTLKSMGVKQIIIMTTLFEGNNEVEFITDYDSFNEDYFYDKQIKELMIEFENIPKTEKTTLTRNNILDMIERLQRMKANKK